MPRTLEYLLGKGEQHMPLILREKQAVTRELATKYKSVRPLMFPSICQAF